MRTKTLLAPIALALALLVPAEARAQDRPWQDSETFERAFKQAFGELVKRDPEAARFLKQAMGRALEADRERGRDRDEERVRREKEERAHRDAIREKEERAHRDAIREKEERARREKEQSAPAPRRDGGEEHLARIRELANQAGKELAGHDEETHRRFKQIVGGILHRAEERRADARLFKLILALVETVAKDDPGGAADLKRFLAFLQAREKARAGEGDRRERERERDPEPRGKRRGSLY